jgi:hypothetical protein
MKNQLTALTKAVRLAQLELGCYRDPHCRATPERTIKRLEALLCHPKVAEALALFAPDDFSTSIAPDLPKREKVDH